MNFRNTAILVAVFALLGGYVYFVEMAKAPVDSTAQGTEKYVFTLGVDDITALQVRDGDKSVFLAKDGAGTWFVGALGAAAADTAQVSTVLYNLTGMRASRVITDVSAGLTVYGLETPSVEVNIQVIGDKTETLLLGDKTPQGASYYALRKGEQAIYLVPEYLVTSLTGMVANPPYMPTPTAVAGITPTLGVGVGLSGTPALTVTVPGTP